MNTIKELYSQCDKKTKRYINATLTVIILGICIGIVSCSGILSPGVSEQTESSFISEITNGNLAWYASDDDHDKKINFTESFFEETSFDSTNKNYFTIYKIEQTNNGGYKGMWKVTLSDNQIKKFSFEMKKEGEYFIIESDVFKNSMSYKQCKNDTEILQSKSINEFISLLTPNNADYYWGDNGESYEKTIVFNDTFFTEFYDSQTYSTGHVVALNSESNFYISTLNKLDNGDFSGTWRISIPGENTSVNEYEFYYSNVDQSITSDGFSHSSIYTKKKYDEDINRHF